MHELEMKRIKTHEEYQKEKKLKFAGQEVLLDNECTGIKYPANLHYPFLFFICDVSFKSGGILIRHIKTATLDMPLFRL